MGGKKPKVKQVNFTPPPPTQPVRTAEDIAYQAQLTENLRLQNEAYARQIAGLDAQKDATNANTTSLIATLQQQLDAQKVKAVEDAANAAKANELLAKQTAVADAARQASEAKLSDSETSQRGFLRTLSNRSNRRARRRRGFLGTVQDMSTSP